jgi:hypothetical protein
MRGITTIVAARSNMSACSRSSGHWVKSPIDMLMRVVTMKITRLAWFLLTECVMSHQGSWGPASLSATLAIAPPALMHGSLVDIRLFTIA